MQVSVCVIRSFGELIPLSATWPVDSSRVGTFLVGTELAVQSQQRRWDDGTRHPQLQPALSSAGTDEWVLSWRLNEESDSCGNRRVVGSRFQVLEPNAAKLRWPVDVRVQGTRSGPGDCRARLTTTVRRRRQHTEVGQRTWRCVVQTILYQHRRLKDHALTNWKPMKCREDQRDVVMTMSAGD